MKHKSNCQDKITKTNSILFESLNIVSLIIMMQKKLKALRWILDTESNFTRPKNVWEALKNTNN